MRDWRERLNEEEGVSILYGIFFMLVATMVSAVVLSAAVSTAERAHAEQERNQNMLVLRSAGDLVRECLEGTKCEVITETVKATGKSSVRSVTAEGPLQQPLETAIAKASGAASATHTPEDAENNSFDVSVTSSDAPEALKDTTVNVNFTMLKLRDSGDEDAEESYKIKATITFEDGGQRLFLVASQSAATAPELVNEDADVRVTKTTVAWDTVELGTRSSEA